jgi:capsular polysaccharide biosynthesis protein
VVAEIESPQSGAAAPVKLTTTQPASVPTVPVAPRKSLNLALGLLVGLALMKGWRVRALHVGADQADEE